jgi:hypothetical protein
MGDTRLLPGLVLVALASAVVFVVLVVVGFSRPGPRRSGIVAGGLPLCLLPPVLAAAYGSWQLLGAFAGMRPEAPGASVLAAFDSVWLLQRLAAGAALGLCLVGLLIGLLRFGGSTGDQACSARRGAVLLLLPVLAFAATALAFRPLVGGLRVAGALMFFSAQAPESQQRVESILAAEGLQSRGSGALGAAARFVTRAPVTGLFAGLTAAVVVLGLALPGFVLAWRVRFGAAFSALALLAWIAAATGAGLVAFGVLHPLRSIVGG